MPTTAATTRRRTDAITLTQLDVLKEPGPADKPEPFKRGFLNDMKRGKSKTQQEMPFLKADKQAKDSKVKEIPGVFFHVYLCLFSGSHGFE